MALKIISYIATGLGVVGTIITAIVEPKIQDAKISKQVAEEVSKHLNK